SGWSVLRRNTGAPDDARLARSTSAAPPVPGGTGSEAARARRRPPRGRWSQPEEPRRVGSQDVGTRGSGQTSDGPLSRRHGIGDSLGVRPIAPDHVRVVADAGYEAIRHLVGERRYP